MSKKVDIDQKYSPIYPLSNNLDTHSSSAKKAYKQGGSLPKGTVKQDAAVNEHYQDETQGHADAAKNKTNNRSMKVGDAKTIGSQVFNGAKSATQFIKKFDPQNSSGTIPFALNLIQQIQSGSGPNKILGDIVGQNLSGIIGQFTNLLQQNLPVQAGLLTSLIQQGLQLKQRIEQLKLDPVPDLQLISSIEQQISELDQQIANINSSGTV
jgi:hypothetical protein